jgi:hypothetical protein
MKYFWLCLVILFASLHLAPAMVSFFFIFFLNQQFITRGSITLHSKSTNVSTAYRYIVCKFIWDIAAPMSPFRVEVEGRAARGSPARLTGRKQAIRALPRTNTAKEPPGPPTKQPRRQASGNQKSVLAARPWGQFPTQLPPLRSSAPLPRTNPGHHRVLPGPGGPGWLLPT